MKTHVLVIDQGTTSSRAMVFDRAHKVVGLGQHEFAQIYPASGLVEHDPEAIWDSVRRAIADALSRARLDAGAIAAIGITNQRETSVIWDRASGAPIHNAIVWQDRRTAQTCARLKADGHERMVTRRTGLLLDPYFSATKIGWLLDHVKGARKRAERGELAFGTIDTFLIWRLTGGRAHVTDATNASRTMLFNIRTQGWDKDLLALFGVPESLLPEVKDCAADFGLTDAAMFGAEVPILGVAGDQQAATIGQAAFEPGMMKSTYGTGCFAVLNTGADLVTSKNRLLSTIAYRLDGEVTYALEGSIFVAGAAVQWLRDGLGIIASAPETDALARAADPAQDVFLVPAFTGLGAPWWDADARGALYGLTRGTGPKELARAALQSVGFQTLDLMRAMRRDWRGGGDTVLRVDGGMVASDYAMAFLADLLEAPVDRPVNLETTALGAAWLAGHRAGLWPDRRDFAARWARERRFEPQMDRATRNRLVRGWRDAVRRTLSTV